MSATLDERVTLPSYGEVRNTLAEIEGLLADVLRPVNGERRLHIMAQHLRVLRGAVQLAQFEADEYAPDEVLGD